MFWRLLCVVYSATSITTWLFKQKQSKTKTRQMLHNTSETFQQNSCWPVKSLEKLSSVSFWWHSSFLPFASVTITDEFAGGCFSDKNPAILSIKITCLHRLAAASIDVDWLTQRIDKIWILKKQEHFYEFFSAARLQLCLVMWFLLVFIIPLQWVNIFAQFWNLEGWC